MDKININAELICEFSNFNSWVNHASSWLGRLPKYTQYICVDTNGNICDIGEDFMKARDNNRFPVKAYRLVRSVEDNEVITN